MADEIVTGSLRDPVFRISRAREHIYNLQVETQMFLHENPYGFIREPDPEPGFQRIRATVNVPPPRRLSTILGDAIHSLRSSLDHLAWQLALMTTPKPFKKTAFPLNINQPTKPIQTLNVIRDLPVGAKNVVESVQPYHGGQWSYLGVLHRLWNDDKHRALVLLAGWVPQADAVAPEILKGRVSAIEPFPGTFEHEKVVVRFKPDPYAEVVVPLGVAFDETSSGAGYEPCSLLWCIYDIIHDEVMPRFSGFFPPQSGGTGPESLLHEEHPLLST
jgi:hypothetical protein